MSNNARDKANSGRVHITYDVHTGGAQVQRELPFVVGVIGDFAGSRKMEPLADRRFVDIDKKNFDTVMAAMKPELTLEYPDAPAQKLSFSSMADFEPGRLAEQIEEVRALKEMRARLRELLTKANRSEDLSVLLKEIIEPGARASIARELGGAPAADPAA